MENETIEEINSVGNMDTADVQVATCVDATADALPSKVTIWSKIRNVLLYEIKVELTPKQEKIFQEVADFWHQDVKDISFSQISGLFSFRK